MAPDSHLSLLRGRTAAAAAAVVVAMKTVAHLPHQLSPTPSPHLQELDKQSSSLPSSLPFPPSLDSFLFLITCHRPWVSIPSLQALCHVSFASNRPESACVTLQPDEIYSRADAVRTARAVVVSGQRAGMAGSGAITRLTVSRCRDFCHRLTYFEEILYNTGFSSVDFGDEVGAGCQNYISATFLIMYRSISLSN